MTAEVLLLATEPWTSPGQGRSWERAIAAGALGEVDGGFAMAWRDAAGTIHLARDAVGACSLFYSLVDGGLRFSTRSRDLADDPAIDPEALAAYLSYSYVPAPRTLLDGVRSVRPGEEVVYDGRHVTSRRFWSLPAERQIEEPEAVARLRQALAGAVSRRAVWAGAASLSGGIDSSLVAALAFAQGERPVLWSLSFGPEYPNELEYARLVAGHLGGQHHVVEVGPRDVVERLDSTMASLSSPNGDPLTVPNARLFAEVGVPVLLNGEGGDPCFGGPKNLPMLAADLYGQERAEAYLLAHRRCYADLQTMLEPELAAHAGGLAAELQPMLSDNRWPTLVGRLMAANITLKGASHILPKVEHLGAAASVVPASPLFDRAVAELAASLPASLRLHGTTEKHVLKQVARGLVPDAVIDRPKSGMRVPVTGWLTGSLALYARERLLDGLAPRGLIRREYLERLLDPDVPAGRRGMKLWQLLALESWLHAYAGSRSAPTNCQVALASVRSTV